SGHGARNIIPRTDGLPRVHHSSAIQVKAPALAARCVATIAVAAREFAPSAEPPLKPNQPTHKSPVPITASARSQCDRLGTLVSYHAPTLWLAIAIRGLSRQCGCA